MDKFGEDRVIDVSIHYFDSQVCDTPRWVGVVDMEGRRGEHKAVVRYTGRSAAVQDRDI